MEKQKRAAPAHTEGGSGNTQIVFNNIKNANEQGSEETPRAELGVTHSPSLASDGHPTSHVGMTVSKYFDDAQTKSKTATTTLDNAKIGAGDLFCIRLDVPFVDLMLEFVGLAMWDLGLTPLFGIDRYPTDLLIFRAEENFPEVASSQLYIGDRRVRIEVLSLPDYLVTRAADLDLRPTIDWSGRRPSGVPVDDVPTVSRLQVEEFLHRLVSILKAESATECPLVHLVRAGAMRVSRVRELLVDVSCEKDELWDIYGSILANGFKRSPEVGFAIFHALVSKSTLYEGEEHAREFWNSYLEYSRYWDNYRDFVADLTDAPSSIGSTGFASGLDAGTSKSIFDNSNGWPEPKPIVAELRPVPTFDADVLLPPVLRDWVMDEAERMPSPPDYIAVAAVVALGSVIGARAGIRPKSSDPWVVMPNLWGGIVGDPGAKKSPAWSAGMKPLDRLSAMASEEHKTRSLAHELSAVVAKTRKDAIKSQFKQPDKLDEETLKDLKQEYGSLDAQGPPPLRRYKTNDCTVEKLGEILSENPNGVLVVRDELPGLMARWEREGGEGEKAFYLESWNGNSNFDYDRIARGHIRIENACVSVFGGIQPDRLIAYLELVTQALGNDGTLQRFQLLAYPDPIPWEWRDRLPNAVARERAFAVFEKLAAFDPVDWGATVAGPYDKCPTFQFDDAAQDICIAFSTELHQKRIPAEENSLIQQHLAKFDKLFPALALIFHLVDCAANGTRGPVTAEAAKRAVAWCGYLEAHARRCYGLLNDSGQRAAQSLADKLARGVLEDGFTLRDVRQKDWRGLGTDEVVQAGLEALEDLRWLRSDVPISTPRGGRPTRRYHINPRITRTSYKER